MLTQPCSLHTLPETFLNILLPPRCFGCGGATLEHHTLCSSCWKNCSFLSSPWCALCGWPFPYETPEQSVCPHCHRLPPLFVQCRSALAYDAASRRFILKFKQGDGTYLAPALAKLILRVGCDILSQTDILIPVPLHWKRLFWRQYNQASLLSHHLSHLTKVPTRTNILLRHKSTPKQGHQSRKDRHANVRGAFNVSSPKVPLIEGKRLTLVDDVFTTGATLNECVRVLLAHGAKEVRILTLARVIKPL
jgi:ComF family protein